MSARRYLCPPPEVLAATLTDEPGRPLELPDELRARLLEALRRPAPLRRPRRLDAFVVERGGELAATPFQWTARTARRSLGRRAARALATGVTPDALRAARLEVERLCDRARCGLERRGGLAPWLAGASTPVREQCAMEAAAWAHELIALLRPERTGVDVGLADAWFEVPGARTTLHARRDATADAGVLRLRDGFPSARAVDGLSVDGLVVALSAGSVPARVVGCWPDTGLAIVVEMTASRLEEAASNLVLAARPIETPSLVAA